MLKRRDINHDWQRYTLNTSRLSSGSCRCVVLPNPRQHLRRKVRDENRGARAPERRQALQHRWV